MEFLYRSQDQNYAIIHNEEIGLYSVRTPSGVFFIPKEILDEIKNKSELRRELVEKVLF